jgi:AraC-like DNA-binding protein
MTQVTDILKVAYKSATQPLLDAFYEKEQHIPGSIHYTITRFYTQQPWMADNLGMLIYHINKQQPEENRLELCFCVANNRFNTEQNNASAEADIVDVFTFHFTAAFLNQFVHNIKLANRKDEVLAFHHPQSFTKLFPLCSRKQAVLEALLTHGYAGAMENVFVNAKIHELLLYSIECLIDEKEEGFTCRFLADESGRERIYLAREILLQRIGEPITIKELSRKVAINECYLKKGFKEVFGTTIFDFYQQQRMEHAKYLLYEKGLSVTDVSVLLGYSSISHFSAAFKKHTGLKPCDLLH